MGRCLSASYFTVALVGVAGEARHVAVRGSASHDSPSRAGLDSGLSVAWRTGRVTGQGDATHSVRYVAGSLIAGVFFGGFSGGVAFPTLPALGDVLGLSALMVGAILALNRFTRLVMNAPAGGIIDRIGTRRPMVFGFLVQGLVPFGYLLGLEPGVVGLSSATVFLLSRICWGIGSAFVFVGAFTTITHITETHNRGTWIGYIRGSQTLGFPAGLVVGGIISDLVGFGEAFLVAGILGLLSGGVAIVVVPDLAADVTQTNRLREVPGLVRADYRILSVSTINLSVRFLFAGILLSTVVLYARRFGIEVGPLSGTGASGVVMGVGVLASGLATILAGRVSDQLRNRAVLALPGLAILGFGFAILAFFPTLPTLLVGISLIGIGVGITNPPLLAFLGDLSPANDVGKLGGVYNVFGDLGASIGPVVAVPMVTSVGFRTGYVLCVGLTVLVCVVAVGLVRAGAVQTLGDSNVS